MKRIIPVYIFQQVNVLLVSLYLLKFLCIGELTILQILYGSSLISFLWMYGQPDQTETNSLTATIEEAIQKQTAVHLILSETSFTGDIIKYDQQGQQIIVKNFSKNVSRIIRISDIQRLRFVPSTVQTAQKNRFKKE